MHQRGVLETIPRPQHLQKDKIGKLLLILSQKRDGRYKARLVYNGRRQKYKLTSYFGSPTLSRDALWTTLSVAAQNGFNFRSLDMTSAFLYADLPDDVTLFAAIPDGHPDSKLQSTHVLRIKKNIHGLKEAPLLWWKHLKQILIDVLKVKQSIHEECGFSNPSLILLVYVDDILAFASIYTGNIAAPLE